MKKIRNLILLLFISAFHALSAQPPTNGMVAYYPFDGNALDASGNGNNPTSNNATLTFDRFGTPNSAYQFNGSSSFIRIPNSASLNVGGNISLCVYVKVSGFYSGLCHGNDILNKGQHGGGSNPYFLRFDDFGYTSGGNCSNPVDVLHQNFYGRSTSMIPGYTPYIVPNTWYCLIFTYDGTTAKLFVDGVQKVSAMSSGLQFNNTSDLIFGRASDISANAGFPYWFNGVLDDLIIYNRALNSDEIATICPSALPVTLLSFESKIENESRIRLNWLTENEANILNYVVERKMDGENIFKEIGTLNALNQTSNTYSYLDINVYKNVNYQYRLAIRERDGSKRFSEITNQKISDYNSFVDVYPNPTRDVINLRFKDKPSALRYKLYNSIGTLLIAKDKEYIEVGEIQKISISNYPSGVYILVIEKNGERTISRVLKY